MLILGDSARIKRYPRCVEALGATDEVRRCPVCAYPGLTSPPYADYTGTVPDDARPPYGGFIRSRFL